MKHILSALVICASVTTAIAQPGHLDPNFGDAGTLVVPHLGSGLDDKATCALVQPDQMIVVAARSSNGTTSDLALMRFNPDGTTDLGFGNNGVAIHSFGDGDEIPHSIAVDSQGRYLVCGTAFSDAANTNSDIFVARLLANGNLDVSFNATGVLNRSLHPTGSGEQGHVVISQPDGKVMMVGQTGPSDAFAEILHERYLEDGTLDNTLQGDGSSLPFVNASGPRAHAGKVDGNGNLLLAGYASPVGASTQSTLLFSIDPNGDVTSGYGESNGFTINSAVSPSRANAIALAPNGMVYLGGIRQSTSFQQMISRYTANGLIDNSFGTNGSVFLNTVQPGHDIINDILIDNDGKILVAGSFGDTSEGKDWVVSRLTDNGSYDESFNVTGSNVSNAVDGFSDCVQLALFDNDKILGAGWESIDGNNHIVLRKYLKDLNTSIENNNSHNSIRAFPNPTSQNIKVTFTLQQEDKIDLYLLDAQGRIVRHDILGKSFTAGEQRITVDMQQLPAGFYQLTMLGLKNHRTTRIVKN